jgi:two-component system cell cycle response regulator
MSTETVSKQRLLIVDDSKVIRVTARKILRDHFDTIEAVDGENAWDTLNNEGPFSLIVSDLTMPKLDGFGLLERIRTSQRPDIRDVPVIIITGANDSEATKLRASQAGATDFIGKPFDSVHLLARTQAHANAHILTDALRQETFKLEERATVDPLTGLSNEIAFMDRAYQQLSYAIRHKTPLSIFLVEVDGHLELGRQYGNPASEAIIKSVASALNTEIRQEDMAARTGTARFGLLLPGMNTAGIRNLSERINRSVSTSPVKQGDERINITVSIGVTIPDIRRDTRLEDLLSEAARHLSLARSQGGNQAVFADSMTGAAESHDSSTTGKTMLSAAAIMEIVSGANTTEIEIDVPRWFEPEVIPEDVRATIECRETTRTAQQAGRLAEPVSGRQRTANHDTPPDGGHGSVTRFDRQTAQKPEVPQGKAVFTMDDMDMELDETIIITAPFDVYSTTASDHTNQTDTEAMASNVSPSARQEKAPEENPENSRPVGSGPEIHDETECPPQRKGFFRHLLGVMRSPFRRRKPL